MTVLLDKFVQLGFIALQNLKVLKSAQLVLSPTNSVLKPKMSVYPVSLATTVQLQESRKKQR